VEEEGPGVEEHLAAVKDAKGAENAREAIEMR